MPSYEDNAYKIRDNQFWYSKCSFAKSIDNEKNITIRITGPKKRTLELEHSEQGNNPQPTKSFTFNKVDLAWWRKNHGQIVQIELLPIGNEILEGDEQPPNNTEQDGKISDDDTSPSKVKKISKESTLNIAGSVLCIGLDIAWFGGSYGKPDSQYDCLGWISFSTNSRKSSQIRYGLKRLKLPDRDPVSTVLLEGIKKLLLEYKNTQRVIFAVDAPIQTYGHRNLPAVRPAKQRKGEVERRACENYLSTQRKSIDKAAGGSEDWHPQIQPGAPLAPRIQRLLEGLTQLGFTLWKKEKKHAEKLVIECFPAEAIWAMKRLGYYSETMIAEQVKAYKKQQGVKLTKNRVRELVNNVLPAFATATGLPLIWKDFLDHALEWMLKDVTWQTPDNLYRGGKLLDDVVDTAICLATAVSYAHGDFHVWQDENCPEDGHIIGPSTMDSLL